jgi:WD40 repeat protein
VRASAAGQGSISVCPSAGLSRRLARGWGRWVAISTRVVMVAGLAACGGADGSASAPSSTSAGVKSGFLPAGVRPVKPAGHLAGVNCLAFSLDGRRIVSGSSDSTLLVWDVESGEIVQRLEGHLGFVRACAFLPGERVVSGGARGEIFVWDLASGKVLRRLGSVPVTHDFYALGVRLDGREVIAGTGYGRVVAWNPDTGEETFAPNDELNGMPNTSRVWTAGYTSEGRMFAGSKAAGTIVWGKKAIALDVDPLSVLRSREAGSRWGAKGTS